MGSRQQSGSAYGWSQPFHHPKVFRIWRSAEHRGILELSSNCSGKRKDPRLQPDRSTLQNTIDSGSNKVELSSDGTALAVGAAYGSFTFVPDRSLNILSLPSGNVIHDFSYSYNTNGAPYLSDFTLAGSGTILGQVLESQNPSTNSYDTASREVTSTDGLPTIWSDAGSSLPIQFSPDGTLIAVATGGLYSSNIYKNGQLVGAVPGYAEGWMDNGRLLAWSPAPTMQQLPVSTIYSSTGVTLQTLSATALPTAQHAQFPSANLVYFGGTAVYSLTNGAVVWQGPGDAPQVVGAVAGQFIIYQLGHQVLLLQY